MKWCLHQWAVWKWLEVLRSNVHSIGRWNHVETKLARILLTHSHDRARSNPRTLASLCYKFLLPLKIHYSTMDGSPRLSNWDNLQTRFRRCTTEASLPIRAPCFHNWICIKFYMQLNSRIWLSFVSVCLFRKAHLPEKADGMSVRVIKKMSGVTVRVLAIWQRTDVRKRCSSQWRLVAMFEWCWRIALIGPAF